MDERDWLSDPETDEEVAIIETEIPQGRGIKPVGVMYQASQKHISEMADDELRNHIQTFRDLIKSAELTLDYRRTQFTMATSELTDRVAAAERKLKNVTLGPAGVTIHLGGNTTAKSKWAGVIEKLKVQGHSDAEIKSMLDALAALVNKSNSGGK